MVCLRTYFGVSREVVGVVGALIREKREAKRFSQTQLADELGTTQRQITRWEAYTKQLPRENARVRIGETLGITLAEWHAAAATAEEAERVKADRLARGLAKRLGPTKYQLLDRIGAYPIIDLSTELDLDVSAGTGGSRANIPQGLEAVGDLEVVPLPDGRLLYALRVTGDCMQPEIMPGWTVRLDPEGHAEDGDIVVAVQDGEKAMVKWLDKDQSMQWLLPLNGEPILIDEHIEIVGVVKDIVKPPPKKPRRRRLVKLAPGQLGLPEASD